ncbi:MAG: imidazole glycerol phosphate synthase subunit HisH [Synergistaceae bacterium]|jgi:glutamine amidotransferase|nr:imidazole glycerol phosphate synthase subunit HisH [Synergistaceae bacterium]
MMIGIIDYGMGNLRSVENAFRRLDFGVFIAASPRELDRADKIVLPGVGAFQGAIETLERQGWPRKIETEIAKGKPFLGICLGMQLLFETSEENGIFQGLGILPGKVTRIPRISASGEEIKIPHMGWNQLTLHKKSGILRGFSESNGSERGCSDPYVYFVHSYRVETDPAYVSASTFYGTDLTAAVERGNIYAVQFHPEKSGAQGMKILKNFAALKSRARTRKAPYKTVPAYGGCFVDSVPRH